jgi:hypothetical protein
MPIRMPLTPWMLVFLFFLWATEERAQAAEVEDSPYVPDGYYLAHHDEFDTAALDETKWYPYFLPHWSDEAHLPYATARYVIEDGILKLRTMLSESGFDQWWSPWDPHVRSVIMTGEYSGDAGTKDGLAISVWCRDNVLGNCVVWSQFANQDLRLAVPRFGYFELRAKAPPTGGATWWMVGIPDDPQHSGEIDVLEFDNSQPAVWGGKCAHFGVHAWNDPNLVGQPYFYGDDCTQFHEWKTYGLLWTKTQLSFYIDGQLVRTIDQSPQYGMVTLLDLGNGLGHPSFPPGVRNQLEIDYFRIYKDHRIEGIAASMNGGGPVLGRVAANAFDENPLTVAQSVSENWDLIADLPGGHAIERVVVRPGSTDWATSYKLRTLWDGAWTVIATVSGATNQPREILFEPPALASKLRFSTLAENTTGDFAHAIRELEIYGKRNLAQGSGTIFVNDSEMAGHPASGATDGGKDTYAQATSEGWDLQVTLDAEAWIDRVVYAPTATAWARDYTVRVKRDGEPFVDVATVTNADGTPHDHRFDPPVRGRRIRLNVTAENATGDLPHGVRELEVYGTKVVLNE